MDTDVASPSDFRAARRAEFNQGGAELSDSFGWAGRVQIREKLKTRGMYSAIQALKLGPPVERFQ